MKERIIEKLSEIEDYRCKCNVKHKLQDVLILIMCGVLCGLDNIKNIVEYGKNKKEFLKENFMINEVPSEATLSRILAAIDVKKVGDIIFEIACECVGKKYETIAVDGKSIRSTHKQNSKEKLHILTAYAIENGLCLAQMQVNEKTNEIPVLKTMIEVIDIKGKTITSDAMGCQKETVAKIIEKEGNYCIGLKGNQGRFLEDVKLYFEKEDKSCFEILSMDEKSRDRFEKRTCYVFKDILWLENLSKWAGLQSIFAIKNEVLKGETRTEEVLFYISSLKKTPLEFLKIVRSHWQIESLHWCLDVVFNEDECLLQNTNAQLNLNLWRKFSLCIHKEFKNVKKHKKSYKNMMFNCLLSDKQLLSLLHELNNR